MDKPKQPLNAKPVRPNHEGLPEDMSMKIKGPREPTPASQIKHRDRRRNSKRQGAIDNKSDE